MDFFYTQRGRSFKDQGFFQKDSGTCAPNFAVSIKGSDHPVDQKRSCQVQLSIWAICRKILDCDVAQDLKDIPWQDETA